MKKGKQYRSNLFIYLFYLETMDTRLNAFVMLPLSSLRFAMRDLRPRKQRFRAASIIITRSLFQVNLLPKNISNLSVRKP